MSNTTLPSATSSDSHPLQLPAATDRSRRERPKRLRIFRSSARASSTSPVGVTRPLREPPAIRYSRPAPRRRSPARAPEPGGPGTAQVGTPPPRETGEAAGPGRGGRESDRASEIVARVGKVEALVAEGKVRDLVAAHGEGERVPVAERGIGDLVAPYAPPVIGDGDVGDLTAPALLERHRS